MYRQTPEDAVKAQTKTRRKQIANDVAAMVEQLHAEKAMIEQMLYDDKANYNEWHSEHERQLLKQLHGNVLSSLVKWTSLKDAQTSND